MRMLIRIKDVTLRDTVKSVDIRKELGVNSIQEKVRKMRLRQYGHMQRMEESNEVRAIVDMIVPGKRLRGHQEGGTGTADHPGDAQDRTFWKSRIRAADPTSSGVLHFNFLHQRLKFADLLAPRNPSAKPFSFLQILYRFFLINLLHHSYEYPPLSDVSLWNALQQVVVRQITKQFA